MEWEKAKEVAEELGHQLVDEKVTGLSSVRRSSCRNDGCKASLTGQYGQAKGEALNVPCMGANGH